MYSWAMFLISIGGLLILISSTADKPWILIIEGLLLIAAGIFMFVKKRKKE